jgi:hypothetical protein
VHRAADRPSTDHDCETLDRPRTDAADGSPEMRFPPLRLAEHAKRRKQQVTTIVCLIIFVEHASMVRFSVFNNPVQ